MQDRLDAQKRAFAAEPFPDLAVRQNRLTRLLALTEKNEPEICAAIDTDFGGRSVHETRIAELMVLRSEIKLAQANLKRWMRERRVSTSLHFWPGRNRLIPQPLGVVGIVSPWNYPFQLALAPTAAALAAGNRVMIKPSETTPRLSELMARLIGDCFSADEVSVITGDAEIGKAFVALPFDHLLFTGSPAVGRHVAQAAAANLTPVTLELGGKSPAIFDASCDVDRSVASVAFGKLLNAGQTCIAPDYLLVPSGSAATVADKLGRAISRLYPTLARNPDYTAIASDRHHQRLTSMVEAARASGARVIEINPASEQLGNTRKFAPTLVIAPSPDIRLMREEIFGPVLPIVEYSGVDQAIGAVNAKERPLALYWFGRDRAVQKRILRETISGGVTINDCLLHAAQERQPFGGVGGSGMGAYRGEWGFRTFSKEKPVFLQSRLNGAGLLHPPYGARVDRVLSWLKRLT